MLLRRVNSRAAGAAATLLLSTLRSRPCRLASTRDFVCASALHRSASATSSTCSRRASASAGESSLLSVLSWLAAPLLLRRP